MRWIILFSLILGVCANTAAKAAIPQTIDPAKDDAMLVCVTERWAVWRTMKMIESTWQHRAPSYHHRFFLQRINEKAARLVHELEDTNVSMMGSVMDDGTFVLVSRSAVTFHTLKSKKSIEGGYLPFIVDVYPDGILVQDIVAEPKHPLEWIPFAGRKLDLEKRQVVWGVNDSTVGNISISHPSVVRHRDKLAFIVHGKTGSSSVNPLVVYDLKSGKRTLTHLREPLDESYEATAFDGKILMAYNVALDAATGKRLPLTINPKYIGLPKAFAVRNGYVYAFDESSVLGFDVNSPDRPAVNLGKTARQDPYNLKYALTEKGIIHWTGKQWQTGTWIDPSQAHP